jgi:putative PIN family toxin of toxin-antitoxin system
VRAVLDPNILIAALLSPAGTPARALSAWLAGEFELIVSECLLQELERALAYSKIRRRVDQQDAAEFVELLRETAQVAADPEGGGSHHSPDPGDDYLLALAESERAVLVTGDADLLTLAGALPVVTARAFVESL